jgi:hypothetical protein
VKLRGGGGIKAWSEDLAWHLEVGGRTTRGGWRRREEVATVGQRGEEDETDSPGPHDREMRGGSQLGRREPKGKRTSVNTPSTRGLAGPARLNSARKRREASGAGGANGRVGRKVGRVESEEKNF